MKLPDYSENPSKYYEILRQLLPEDLKSEWVEVTRTNFDEMLDVLPPVQIRFMPGVGGFMVGECLTHSDLNQQPIYEAFVRILEEGVLRYFSRPAFLLSFNLTEYEAEIRRQFNIGGPREGWDFGGGIDFDPTMSRPEFDTGRNAPIPDPHAVIGAIGGRSKSPEKIQAARENGKKGGRPRKGPSFRGHADWEDNYWTTDAKAPANQGDDLSLERMIQPGPVPDIREDDHLDNSDREEI